jgi:uncharacterized membrane protein
VQEPFWRLEVVTESSGGLTPLNTSKEDRDQTTSKGDRKSSSRSKVQRKNLGSFRRSCQGAMSGRNSPWRICEVT